MTLNDFKEALSKAGVGEDVEFILYYPSDAGGFELDINSIEHMADDDHRIYINLEAV